MLRTTAWLMGCALLCAAAAANADEVTVGHRATLWESARFVKQAKDAAKLAKDYKAFIGTNKTEREVVAAVLKAADKKGYTDLFAAKSPKLKPGSKVYAQVHGKLAALVIVGKQPLAEGAHVVATHIDAVRLDLKQSPLYADANVALLETHYYGGIKKYQWLSEPLELRGVVVKKGGERVDVAIGDDPDEPVLIIPDLAGHVSWTVDKREGEEIDGERLDPILSSTPAKGGDSGGSDPFAAEAARLLESEYGIALSDLKSAELELVPAAMPRDVGIDRALIGAYGQDDRSCAFAALRALFSLRAPEHTAIVMFMDREEIGSTGNTGARSNFVRRVMAELLAGAGEQAGELEVDRALAASMVFSADVSGAINPQYADLYDPKNNAFLGSGVIWDQSAVHAEVMSYVRSLFERAGVMNQAATWTKIGNGGGGTILSYFTQHGMNGLDVSIPLLSMHAPYEVISKADLYEAYRAYQAFLAD